MYVPKLELGNQFQSFICTRKCFSNQTRYFFIIKNNWYLVYYVMRAVNHQNSVFQIKRNLEKAVLKYKAFNL